MDALLKVLLAALVREGVKVGSSVIERGAGLAIERIEGRASDEAVMQWLREAQDGGTA